MSEVQLSPRNQIPCPNVYSGGDNGRECMVQIDTLFEICDAQFNSEVSVHAVFERIKGSLKDESKDMTKPLTKAFFPLVMKASRSVEELNLMHYSDHNCSIVAGALARMWIEKWKQQLLMDHQAQQRQKGKK